MCEPAPSITGKTWTVKTAPGEGKAEQLARNTGVHPLVASILQARGYLSEAAILDFLAEPLPGDLHDPWFLAGMELAVERLLRARDRKEKIIVHGDYDVDGVTAAVLTKRALDLAGFPDVDIFIPHRIDDGYGLTPATARRVAGEGYHLLIAVDCGTSDIDAVQLLNDGGVDVLILDHHQVGSSLPAAVAMINPRQPGCGYPFKDLCSAGLAFKLSQALHLRLGRPFNAAAYASMAALGTIADLVPLRDENRLLVRLGLPHLSRPASPGIRELLQVSGVEEGRAPSAGQVGFHLGPRINAAGRLDSAELAARLFLTGDDEEARQIAHQLDLLNSRRQHQESELVEQLLSEVEATPDMLEERILVMAGQGWPRGVIGIAASRLVETFNRPAVVVSLDDHQGHGSCRSVKGFNITSALEEAAGSILLRFGGHAMAAGLTLETGKVAQFRAALHEYCRRELDPALLVPRASADIEADPSLLERSLLEQLDSMEPFGMGNPRPVFLVRGLRLDGPPVRLKEKHMKMKLRGGGQTIEAIWWRAGHLLPALLSCGDTLDVLGKLELNRWGGRETVRLNISDIRATEILRT
jgi:single-stranded-DNA-specific exonuclease